MKLGICLIIPIIGKSGSANPPAAWTFCVAYNFICQNILPQLPALLELLCIFASLIFFGNEAPSLQSCLVIIGVVFWPIGQLHLFSGHLFVRNEAQEVRDAV